MKLSTGYKNIFTIYAKPNVLFQGRMSQINMQ